LYKHAPGIICVRTPATASCAKILQELFVPKILRNLIFISVPTSGTKICKTRSKNNIKCANMFQKLLAKLTQSNH
jgi:hypothetical protein